MSRYRRVWVPGGTCFFTVNLLERHRTLLVDEIAALRLAFRAARAVRPFTLLAIVVLPDHLHCVWRLPDGDADNATRWRHIKSAFSRHCAPGEWRTRRRIVKAERGLWQRRYWEHLIRDEDDLQRHVDYVHFNPVKHGHARRAADWPYSSLHRLIARGEVAADWACAAGPRIVTGGEAGERAGEGAESGKAGMGKAGIGKAG